MIQHRYQTGRVNLIGDMTGPGRIGGTQPAALRRKNMKAGRLTGKRIRMVRGRRTGVEGVLESLYMDGPRYWARLEDGVNEVPALGEFEVIE